jgi:SET domain-containing protein
MPRTAPLYEIRKSKIQGKGAFALRAIPAGKRITEYTGEIITAEESERRYDDAQMKRHDAGPRGSGDAKFINHSCDPNCEAVMEGNRIFIDAKKDIEAGTELVYDYKYNVQGPIDDETRAMYVCHCGARRCRGTILAPKRPAKKKVAKTAKTAKKKTSHTKTGAPKTGATKTKRRA